MGRLIYIRESDGKSYNSVEDAVKDYMCPGPCDDGLCKLYKTVTLPNGKSVHICNKEYVNKHPFEICHALGLKPIETECNQPEKFIALITGSAVRDCQVCRNADLDPMADDDWYDFEQPHIYLGTFKAFSQNEAQIAAAKFAQTATANIKIIPVKSL